MGRLILVLGGARSGKSRFAQDLAVGIQAARGGSATFVATAAAGDREMEQRIDRHRADRPAGWDTLEAQVKVASALAAVGSGCSVMLVDCLTLLASNVLLAAGDPGSATERMRREVEEMVRVVRAGGADAVVVSNEVGLGVVPSTALGRAFRDLAGGANQWMAAEADEVYFLVAGLPQRLK